MNYLFLAIAPYSGSTILHNYLAKCKNVVKLTFPHKQETGVIEGNVAIERQYYYLNNKLEIPGVPGNYVNVLKDPANYDWQNIKNAWDKNWAESNPEALIRLQKTPTDLYRVQLMQPYFEAKWIISVRNPYAYVQSIIEKLLIRNIRPQDHTEKIASHVINTYIAQNENKIFLGDKAYVMTYEDFVANEDNHTVKIKEFLPDLYDLTFKGKVLYKHTTATGLVNNNEKRIETFKKIPGALNKFNSFFKPYEAVINSWGYELI